MPLAREELSAALASFYAGPYHCFRATTSPIEKSAELVEALLNRGLLVAIATNPLFPAGRDPCARIAWAGLADFIDKFRVHLT